MPSLVSRFLIPCAVLVGALGAFSPACAEPVGLRDTAIVDGDYVLLGQLFSGLPAELAGTPAAHAPQPGKRSVLDYRWLAAIAERNAIVWRPRSRHDRVLLERASQIIDGPQIEAELHHALLQKGLIGEFEVELASRSFRLHLPTDVPPGLEVRDIRINARTRRFVARLLSAPGSDHQRDYKVSGSYHPVIEVPVLVRDLRRGDLIGADDIVPETMRADRLRSHVLRDREDLIGKSARRALRAGQPLDPRDVQVPVLVERNALVTITLRTPNMTLIGRGKALENGGMDQTVRIQNQDSRRTIEAVVTGPNRVGVVLTALAG